MNSQRESVEREGWPYALLSKPRFYDVVQRALISRKAWEKYVWGYVKPQPGARILDIGCGTATVLKYLPSSVEYVGFDKNEQYIAYAQRLYGHRGRLVCQSVSEAVIDNEQSYDIVLANSIIHHLGDDEAKQMVELARKALVPNGVLLTWDNVLVPGQHWLAKSLITRDRGACVRTSEGYLSLARPCFSSIQSEVLHDYLRIPYTVFVMRCVKKSEDAS